MFLSLGVNTADATTTVKILSDSRHAYSVIIDTINLLMGTGHIGTDFIVHSTNMVDGGFSSNPNNAINASTTFYDQTGTAVPSAAPYQIFTQSSTGYTGDRVSEYNTFAPYDLTYNYAYSNIPAPPATTLPPGFRTAPGGSSYASNYGVEWTLDSSIFNTSSLSAATAADAGMMAVMRFLHPTWNRFDVKAAIRQTATNWATGYNKSTYGFGRVNYATATALTDNQILLQPPAFLGVVTSGRINFTLFPFKQTRRVKEVLFQFPSAPAFQANELTLSAIQALGGTKIGEYSGTTATTSTPFYSAITNGYYAYLTADNADDNLAHFSRIDTYSVQGPLSQSEVAFDGPFNTVTPATNAITATTTPTFTWGAVSSYWGVSKYQLYIDGVLDTDNLTGTSSTPSNPLSPGTHTWYVKAFNAHGAATTTTATPTLNVNTGYAPGYTFYVDNVLGNDANPGTQAQPWATLAKATATAAAGDTVVIIKNVGVPYRETLTPVRSGTATSTITFRGVDASTKPEIWGSADVSTGWSVYGGGNPDTYQQTATITPGILAAGTSISTLTDRTEATSTALNPGQWYWSSNMLYYRLLGGESTTTLHVEAGSLDYGILSNGGKNYITFQNLIVRYANSSGVSLWGSNNIAQNIEEYDSYAGADVEGTGNIVRYSIFARNLNDGINLSYPANGRVYNSLSYGNNGYGVRFSAYGGLTMTMRNIISAVNSVYSFGQGWVFNGPTILTGNNLWDLAGDTVWDTYKGTNNQELVNPLFSSPGTSNFQLQELSPAIDAGTSGSGATTDILGNPIYGTPDIGPYEYQPPYTMGVDNIDSSGSIRIYNDGKYRYTTAHTGGTTAHLTLTPSNGFSSGDHGEFLNVTIGTWNTSGDYSKTWTESSPSVMSTLHTVGDLNPTDLYNVTVDGVTPPYTQIRADSSGSAQFTYLGSSGTHSFALTKYDAGGTSYIYGCTDPVATNYDPSATSDDGRCVYAPASVITPVTTDTGAPAQSGGAGSVVASGTSTTSTLSTSTPLSVATSTATSTLLATSTATSTMTSASSTVDSLLSSLSSLNAASTSVSSGTEENIFTAMRIFSRAVVRSLSFGMYGDDVWRLQDRLRDDPLIYPEGILSGYFGHLTERAVQRFQEKHNIVATGTPETTGYGVFGPKTRSVLFVVASLINTSPSATSTASSTSVNTPSPRAVVYRTLSFGMSGTDVLRLQTFLAEDPTVYPEGVLSGYFGKGTERAVRRFQEKHNIVATGTPETTGYGVFGKETRKEMQGF